MEDTPYRASPTPLVPDRPRPVPPTLPVPAALRRRVVAMWGLGLLIPLVLLGYLHQMRTLIGAEPALHPRDTVNLFVYGALAYGVSRYSRIAACAMLVYAEAHAMLIMRAWAPLPVYALLAPAAILLVMMIGTQAIFRLHRLRRDHVATWRASTHLPTDA